MNPDGSAVRTAIRTLTELIAGLSAFLGQFEILVTAIAWLVGAAMLVIGLNAAARRSEQGPGNGGWGSVIGWFLAGSFLLALPAGLQMLSQTFFEDRWSGVTAEIFTSAPTLLTAFEAEASRETIVGILRFVQFIGILAVFRGVLMLNAAAQPAQRATVGAGLTHVIGGALAVNIGPVLVMLEGMIT